MTTAECAARPVAVCSLVRSVDQTVYPEAGYTVVRFPFGDAESYDGHGMHQVEQPDGYTIADWDTDERSGLIWPARHGWGELHAVIQWESGGYSELRDQFVRDPLAFGLDPENTTGTDHRPKSIGMQCFTKAHAMFVHPDTPIALRVAHNDSVPRRLVHAQLKLTIHDA
jgi:hypothetical protein